MGEKKCKINTAKNDIGGPGRIGTIEPIQPKIKKIAATNTTKKKSIDSKDTISPNYE